MICVIGRRRAASTHKNKQYILTGDRRRVEAIIIYSFSSRRGKESFLSVEMLGWGGTWDIPRGLSLDGAGVG